MITNSNNHVNGFEAQLHPVDRASMILGIGRSKTFQLLREGRLRSVKVDGKRLVPQRAIEEFLQAIGA
jgi:excisionase family DNA binding protein